MKERVCCQLSILVGLMTVLGACAVAPALADVTVAANFTGGNADNVVDAYIGMVGDGWLGPWKESTANGPATTATVVNTDPFDLADENYLSYTVAGSATANSRGSLARSYTGYPGGIDVVQPHTISFKYRIDEELTAGPWATEASLIDTYQLFDWTDVRNNTTSSVRWTLSGRPEALLSPDNWMGQDWSTGSGVYVDSGVQLQQGVVYNFEITVRGASEARKWDFKVNDGTTFFDSKTVAGYENGLTWRSADSTVGGYINFNTRCSDNADTRQFSLDALSIVGQPNSPPPDTNPGPYRSPTVATFNGGGSGEFPVTDVVDAYYGMPGDGWRTAWGSPSTNCTTTHQVLGADGVGEIKPDHDSYLSFNAQGSETGGAFSAAVTRTYKTTGGPITGQPGITWTREHTIQFTMRIDEDVDSEFLFTGMNDKYAVFDSPTSRTNTFTGTVWHASASGDTFDPEHPEYAGAWLFYDGDGAGSGTNVTTGINIASNGVYDFTIIVDPVTMTYDAILSDGTTTWDSRLNGFADGLGWRAAATEVGGYLCFAGLGDSFEDNRLFSLDDIVISQSPPPSIPGDTNGDQIVDATDAQKVAQNWGANVGSAGSSAGDFNGDELVNAADASILAANWGNHVGRQEAAAVPEPSMIVLLLGVVAAPLVRRRC